MPCNQYPRPGLETGIEPACACDSAASVRSRTGAAVVRNDVFTAAARGATTLPRQAARRCWPPRCLPPPAPARSGCRPTPARGENRPVGAELVRHDDARHHPHCKDTREDLDPVPQQVHVVLATCLESQAFQHRQVTGQPDGDGGEEEVEADGERELDARQQQGVGHIGPQRPILAKIRATGSNMKT